MPRVLPLLAERIAALRPVGAFGRVACAVLVAATILLVNPFGAFAANPPTVQLYFVALPEDDLLALFESDDEQGGTWPDASSPLRSITSISIADSGTLVYYDQWEDGGYDGDIANPGANTYDASTNPDGTQIWGDGILTNGCPPSINNSINPCTLSAHDQLSAGQILTLDNDVAIPLTYNVLDQFNTVAYNNNNGTANWLNDWTEIGDNSNPASGQILITSNQLRFADDDGGDSLTRSANLTGMSAPRLRFTASGANLETDGTDEFIVQASTNGTTYTTLATLDGLSADRYYSLDLSGFISSNTRIRFASLDGSESTEYYTFEDVGITASPGTRSASTVYFDGRDKVGVSAPIAMTRLAFPISPGSVMAGAAEVLDTTQYGTFFVAPVGEDTPVGSTSPFEDVRWFVMAQAGGATIDVDANGDGDLGDANDLNDAVLAQGASRIIDGINEGGTLTVVSGSAVQVHNMMADVGDTFEFRWDALIPRNQWSGDYYSPVGTDPDGDNGNRGCTEVWIHNPAVSAPFSTNVRDEFGTVSYANNNGSSNWTSSWVEANDLTDNYRDEFASQAYNNSNGSVSWSGNSWTEENDDGSPTGGDITIRGGSDDDLEIGDDAAVDVAIFRQVDLSAYSAATFSYDFADSAGGATDAVVVEVRDSPGAWSELATITGSSGSGTNSHDISSFIASDTQIRFRVSAALEGSDEIRFDNIDISVSGSPPSTGDVQIVSNRLRIGEDNDATITRSANLSGASSATLTFDFDEEASGGTDTIVVEVNDFSPDTWVTVGTYQNSTADGPQSISLTPYIASTTSIRFRVSNTLEANDFMFFDNVNIAYSGTSGTITVNIDLPGGSTPDSTLTIPPQTTDEWPAAATALRDDGFRLYTTGGEPFLPVQIVDCTKDTSTTDGRLFDWGAPLIPADQLTDEVVVGYAAGCSNESFSGICHDPDSSVNGSTPDITSEASRSVVWVTALANTTIYVDTNGSGISCPSGTGAEQSQAATALVSYRFDDDPSSRNYVHDLFSTQSYSRDDIVDGWDGTGGRTTPNPITWTGNWTEANGEPPSDPAAGAIQINTTDDALRLQELAATSESGRTIHRIHNTSGNTFARLSFILTSATTLDANDRIAVEVSGDGGSTWVTLDTFTGPYNPGTWPPTTEVYNISPYIATNTAVRFRFVDDMETGDYWQIDDVHIDYVNGGDYDMTASRIKTCDGTLIAAAYGQDPEASGGNDEEAQDFGTLVPPFRQADVVVGSLGDYVWVDEDGDGDQDAGEVGIPNVRVTLTGTAADGTTYNLVTYTDANGGYLFPNLKAANASGYTVTVDTTTLPAGLAANPTYDEDGIVTPHTATVILGTGEEHTRTDFGYNWSSPAETNTPGAGSTGAIGDRVWYDVDGDGNQDPNEIGIQGVTVQLITAGPDGLFGTGDDVVAATTATDHFGNYIFDGLTAGAYVVRIPTPPASTTQTGDPDATLDDETTDPIVLGPGDVFLDADFGYQPTGATGSIGDLVWLDADRGNDKDVGEPGIPGVTVSLIKDLDGDGVWDIGEPIIATDITDENGLYGFNGLPITDGTGTDDYLVWVNDTRNVLGELSPTYDVRDGGSQGNPTTGVATGLEISAVTNLTSTPVTDADFAYAPSGHDVGEGLIGDTIFYDRDADGAFDPGEGIEGVTVQLLSGTTLLATTTTDENGNYSFGGLGAGTYTVQVIATTLPNAGLGLTNTVDPDGGTANQSSVTIGSGGINLLQDFGYRDTANANAIGGTIWEDRDADGTLEGGETERFEGVTVTLYEDSNGNGILDGGDAVVGTTSTDSNGDYLFSNLPDGAYLVDVTDDANHLNGYWHSLGDQSQAADNESKTDPYLVSVSGGQTVTTVDYGYYRDPAAIGNFVWHDLDGDGIQDGGEPGIAGVEVVLTITWPNSGGTTVLRTLTDSSGFYSFGNLLLDEDHNGVGAGEPTFVVSVPTAPSGYDLTLANQGGNDAVDSDLASGVSATPIEGTTDNTYDFGYAIRDLAVETTCFDYTGTSPYTIASDTVTHDNSGGNSVLSATGLTLVHTLPANVTYDSFSASTTNGGTTNCTPAGQVVTCTLTGTFAPSDTWSVDFIVTFPGGPLTNVDNSATIDSTETDVDATNDSSICSSTTPVTLASFRSQQDGDAVRFTWSTATETGNLGFNLYAEQDGRLVRLNDRLIPSKGRDAFGPSSYAFVAEGVQADRFVVEDVDLRAKPRRHGAFELDKAYGAVPEVEPIDWAAVRAEDGRLAAERRAADAEDVAERLAGLEADDPGAEAPSDAADAAAGIDANRASRQPAPSRAVARFAVDRDGMVLVTYEALLAAGIDLRSVNSNQLAVVSGGVPVPVRVSTVGARFGPRSTLEFYGEAVDGLYTRTNAYDLVVDARLQRSIGEHKTAKRLTAAPEPSYQETLTIETDRVYSQSAPGADPWYDLDVYVYDQPASWNVPLPVDDAVDGTATVALRAFGGSDFPTFPDHHVRFAIDGRVVADGTFDGLAEYEPVVTLPSGGLRPDSQLTLTLPGDTGAEYDVVGYDQAVVTYPRAFVARDGRLSFTSAGRAFRVTGLAGPEVAVYRFVAGQLPERYDRVAAARQPDGTYAATFEGLGSESRYEVVSGPPMEPAGIAPLRAAADIAPSNADYVMIVHPNFADGIAPLAAHHRANGLRVKVVDVRDVYDRHSHGVVDPQAIKRYVAEAEAAGVRFVLLVGGDTYDYLNHVHPTAMSFIPTLYERTDPIVFHAPVDPRLADVDDDGVPDVAIGRLPVKTIAELQSLVDKTLAYAAKPYVRTALFASDARDAAVDFRLLSGQLIGLLPQGWRVTRSDLDTDGLAGARAALLGAIEEGAALTNFVGHSGPTAWTFSGLFASADAQALANAERPTVVVQWGCWNTYHTTPYYHTLSHALLLSGDRGAAATLGASALTLASSEQRLGEQVVPRLAVPGATIGEAVLEAKQALGATHPELVDVLLGWNVLGDPAIVVDP